MELLDSEGRIPHHHAETIHQALDEAIARDSFNARVTIDAGILRGVLDLLDDLDEAQLAEDREESFDAGQKEERADSLKALCEARDDLLLVREDLSSPADVDHALESIQVILKHLDEEIASRETE